MTYSINCFRFHDGNAMLIPIRRFLEDQIHTTLQNESASLDPVRTLDCFSDDVNCSQALQHPELSGSQRCEFRVA